VRVLLREIAEQAAFDPKKALLDALGDISGIEVLYNNVLVATYIEPEMTPGGIIKPDRSLMESRFQGKAYLVLKLGPTAFKYDGSYPYEGPQIESGDWIFARPSDGWELYSTDATRQAGTSCRIFEDRFIMGRVKDPAAIW
jgi:hypothetical protein